MRHRQRLRRPWRAPGDGAGVQVDSHAEIKLAMTLTNIPITSAYGVPESISVDNGLYVANRLGDVLLTAFAETRFELGSESSTPDSGAF